MFFYSLALHALVLFTLLRWGHASHGHASVGEAELQLLCQRARVVRLKSCCMLNGHASQQHGDFIACMRHGAGLVPMYRTSGMLTVEQMQVFLIMSFLVVYTSGSPLLCAPTGSVGKQRNLRYHNDSAAVL